MPREQEVVPVGKSQPLRARVEFRECLEARVIERWIPPPRRRLRPSHRQTSLVEGHVLPLQRFDFARAQSAEKPGVAATYAKNRAGFDRAIVNSRACSSSVSACPTGGLVFLSGL